MIETYVGLVQAYLRDGNESDLAEIGALRADFIIDDVPIEDLVGLHERAMLSLKGSVSPETFEDVIIKTSTCLTELMIAYSLADQKRKGLLEREQRMERERQRLEALGQMAGGVAHEFNNLLQPIMGMAEMALEDVDPGSEVAEQLGIILECAGQAAAVVRGILTTARKQGPPPRVVPFAPILRKTMQFLAAIMPRGVALDLAISCGDDCVLCEEAELAQVLLNLVRNASDAMNGTGTIRIGLQRLDGEPMDGMPRGPAAAVPSLCLSVADHGIGMPPEIAARVFQPFFTTKPPNHGTGLGLSIVMAIAHGWHGSVDVETAPGAGTRIKIILPIAIKA